MGPIILDNQFSVDHHLLEACKYPDLCTIEYILTQIHHPRFKINIELKDTSDMSLLAWACSSGGLDIVKFLLTSPKLKTHANLFTINRFGHNLLINATQSGRLEILKYLLEDTQLKEDIYLNHKDNTNHTFFHWACINGHFHIIQYLIIEDKIVVNQSIIEWLSGKNDKNVVYHDCLKIIEKKNLYQKLNNMVKSDNINNNKIKL